MKRAYIKRKFNLNKYRRPDGLKRKTFLSPIGGGKVRIFKYNKFSNDSSYCNQKHLHDSKGEARYCESLALLEKAGEIKSYKIQHTFSLMVNGKRVTTHRVDFLVMTKEGKLEVNETKGFPTPEWNLKRKLFEAVYPDIPYIVVKI